MCLSDLNRRPKVQMNRICSVAAWSRTDALNIKTPIMQSTYVNLVPNTLLRSPMQWTAQDVKVWLRFCVEEFSLSPVCVGKFDMNGKALCLLTRKDFMERSPNSGDVLYNAFQKHQQDWPRQTTPEQIFQLLPSPARPLANTDVIATISAPQGIKAPFVSILPREKAVREVSFPDNPIPGTTNRSLENKDGSMLPGLSQVPSSMLSPAPSGGATSDSEHGSSPHNSDPDVEADDVNADIIYDPENPTDDGVCRLLWEFIYQLLLDSKSFSKYVCWESESDLTFRINNPNELAEFWGKQKNRTNMTYEKLSRALRYYYKMDIIKKVPGKRLTYQFLQHPTKIRKGQRGARPHCSRSLTPANGEAAPMDCPSSESKIRPTSSLSGSESPPVLNNSIADNSSSQRSRSPAEYSTPMSPESQGNSSPGSAGQGGAECHSPDNKDSFAVKQQMDSYVQLSPVDTKQKIVGDAGDECSMGGNSDKYIMNDVTNAPVFIQLNANLNGFNPSAPHLQSPVAFSNGRRYQQPEASLSLCQNNCSEAPHPNMIKCPSYYSPRHLSPEFPTRSFTPLQTEPEPFYRHPMSHTCLSLQTPQYPQKSLSPVAVPCRYSPPRHHPYASYHDNNQGHLFRHSPPPSHQPDYPNHVSESEHPQQAHLSVKYETCDEQPEDLSVKSFPRKDQIESFWGSSNSSVPGNINGSSPDMDSFQGRTPVTLFDRKDLIKHHLIISSDLASVVTDENCHTSS
ncbi:Transcription factor etv7 [Bulinus truncatus]|nr:Transcription factor etv7 [Bulinus truncatus]